MTEDRMDLHDRFRRAQRREGLLGAIARGPSFGRSGPWDRFGVILAVSVLLLAVAAGVAVGRLTTSDGQGRKSASMARVMPAPAPSPLASGDPVLPMGAVELGIGPDGRSDPVVLDAVSATQLANALVWAGLSRGIDGRLSGPTSPTVASSWVGIAADPGGSPVAWLRAASSDATHPAIGSRRVDRDGWLHLTYPTTSTLTSVGSGQPGWLAIDYVLEYDPSRVSVQTVASWSL